jgi:short-subunit dehydrogenase
VSGRFAGRVVVITGASLGVGAATARAFARDGARLVLVARGREALERIAAELQPSTEIMFECVDVCDAAACDALLRRAAARYGRIDVLVNNAGLHVRGPLEHLDPADVARMVEVNLIAPLVLARLALPQLARSGGGAIVNVASLSGMAPLPGAATYSATKAGLRAFSRALAEELRGRGVTVSLVSPGPVDTGFIMDQLEAVEDLAFSQPISTADEVAAAVLEAAATGVAEISLPRQGARLATLAYLFPALARRMRPVLQRRGARVKAELIRRRRSQ